MSCPACGSPSVSVEVGPTGFGRLADVLLRAEEGDAVRIVRDCWTCGWRETRDVVVDSIAAEPGDHDVVARRRLVERVTEHVSALEEDALRDALATIEEIAERQR